ncbi:MAG TPA: glycosyltransferase, partial [Actinomycetota bacterium]|nr:glycosyltransferase [Actinomycetota bacterium]
MKVLHVVATSQRRGAEVFAADLVAALSDLGVEQEVAVLRDGLPPSVEFPVPAVDLGGEGDVVPGIRVAPRAVRGLRRAVGRFRPNVVQLHGGEPLKYAVAAGLDRRVPLVYRRIGDRRQLRGGAPRTWVYGWLMRRAARVVAVADALRGELVERFRVPPSRVLTIPNGVDLRRLEGLASKDEARDLLGLPREARVILSLGALTWEKDPLGHLAVTGLVLEQHRGAFHLVVGDGPLRGRVAQAIRAGRFADRIRLLPT